MQSAVHKFARNRRSVSRASRVVLAAVLVWFGSVATPAATFAVPPATRLYPNLPELRGVRTASGTGVGQLACRDFSKAVQDRDAGGDDGLYYAFLAWRDGFVTAVVSHAIQSALVSDQADVWLGAYCNRNPTQRFAYAVATLVRHISGARSA